MIFDRFVVGPLQTNCYLLGDPDDRKAVVIDPGGEAVRIVQRIEKLGLDLVAILITHAHLDHIKDAWSVRNAQGGKIHLHPADRVTLMHSMVAMGLRHTLQPGWIESAVDVFLNEEDTVQCGLLQFKIIETPGHTPGHVSFLLESAGLIFVGDTLFAGSIGRTDFPGGSFSHLIQAVREKIFPLNRKTIVYPGHGPETTIEREILRNPFFQ